jgi:endonuclease VIII
VPEGDSIHRAAARLSLLVGDRIEAESPHPQGLATGVARAVDGRQLEGVEAVGKNLLLRFEGGVVLRSHLRMSGRWRVDPRGTRARRGGRPWLVLRGSEWEATQWNGPLLTLGDGRTQALGPDLLTDETSPAEVVVRIRGADRRRLVGEALVDQHLLSGIGNMWLAEALWHARISPWAPLAALSDDDLESAIGWARTAMRASVGGQRPRRAVYRRAGRGCPRCGAVVQSRGLGDANRTAYWCPSCQPGPGS